MPTQYVYEFVSEVKAADNAMKMVLRAMRAAKPNNRSEMDRAVAICVTDLEKVNAYFSQYVLAPALDAQATLLENPEAQPLFITPK